MGKEKYPLDDEERALDPGPYARLGAVFRLLDFVY
jgi:hypothetical protein